jgi:hypothetical protein
MSTLRQAAQAVVDVAYRMPSNAYVGNLMHVVSLLGSALASQHADREVLSEGELMGVYMDFDRKADKAWTNSEYLLHFARAVEQATIKKAAA